MNGALKIFLLLSLMLELSSCGKSRRAIYNSSYDLTSGEYDALQTSSERGSGEASLRLFDYYDMYKKDYAMAGIYLRRSAQQNYPPGVETLAKIEQLGHLERYGDVREVDKNAPKQIGSP